MSCKKCKRLPEDLLKLEHVIIEEIDVKPFSYENNEGDIISFGFAPYKLADEVTKGKTVKYDGKIYIPNLETKKILVKIDNEQEFKKLYDEYQYVIDYLIKNKGKVLKTVDIPVEFDCFKSNKLYFPCISTLDERVDLHVCQTTLGGGRYGNMYNYPIHLASLTLRDPKIITETLSVSESGETSTTYLTSVKPRELTQTELLNSPRSEIITRWYDDKGYSIYKCDTCITKYDDSGHRPFSHIFHNFRYVMLTKVTLSEFSMTDKPKKEEVHHSLVPLKVKGVLEPGMSVVHENYVYTYEKNISNVITYYKTLDDSEEAFEYYNKYSSIVKDISKYVGVVIKPKELGITKDVYAQNVPVVCMGKDNIGLVIKKTSNKWSRVMVTLATIEFQIVFA